jgi:homoserine kinase
MVAAARGAGALGACLSGAGSSILAFAEGQEAVARTRAAFEAAAAACNLPGRTEVVLPRNAGARVESVG